MTTNADLWGELEPTDVRTPVSILREQAALLGQKTKNLVEASVETTTSTGTFYHTFNLVAPALDNYTYQLFRVRHGIELYPIYVQDLSASLESSWWEWKSEDEFREWLKSVLSSNKTKRVIRNLIAQASG